jgi:hypothetical protein
VDGVPVGRFSDVKERRAGPVQTTPRSFSSAGKFVAFFGRAGLARSRGKLSRKSGIAQAKIDPRFGYSSSQANDKKG